MALLEGKLRLDIVVVEDDTAAVKNALEAYGRHNVHVARSVNELLNYLLKCKRKPDLIISDVFVRRNRIMPRQDNVVCVLDLAYRHGIPLCFVAKADRFGFVNPEGEGTVSIAPLTPEDVAASVNNIAKNGGGFESVVCKLITMRADGMTVDAWKLALDCMRNALVRLEAWRAYKAGHKEVLPDIRPKNIAQEQFGKRPSQKGTLASA
ncbi:MAG: hypothetical protein N3H30_01090 [Candidatus Micrarchaeota archaeon]|nr:hypothetical protein [Candidatus Micrarchaeota archaeon]